MAHNQRSAEAAEYRKLYKTAAWLRLRAAQIAKKPLCERCEERGVIRPAKIVDHALPHQGDTALFYDSANLVSLCKPCHDVAKQREEVALGYHGAFQHMPEWLRPSVIPLHIVCGPPASGKSTYVAERAGGRDLVIDVDVIASELSGQPLHGWSSDKWLSPAIRLRNGMLGELSKAPRYDAAWLILSAAKAEHRQWWADKMRPASITVLEVPAAECMARVRADATWPREATFEAIGKWWSAYGRRAGDVIVKHQ